MFPACRKSSFSIRQISDTHTFDGGCDSALKWKWIIVFCDAAWKIQCILTYIFISFIHYFFSAIIRHRMQKRMAAAISFLLFACGASAANRWRAEKYDERWDACTLEFCFNIDRLRGKRGRERERYYHGRRIKETMKKACGRQMVPNTNNACVLNSETPTQSLSTFSWPVVHRQCIRCYHICHLVVVVVPPLMLLTRTSSPHVHTVQYASEIKKSFLFSIFTRWWPVAHIRMKCTDSYDMNSGQTGTELGSYRGGKIKSSAQIDTERTALRISTWKYGAIDSISIWPKFKNRKVSRA